MCTPVWIKEDQAVAANEVDAAAARLGGQQKDKLPGSWLNCCTILARFFSVVVPSSLSVGTAHSTGTMGRRSIGLTPWLMQDWHTGPLG